MTANTGEPEARPEAPPRTRPVGRIPADTFSNRLLLARKLAGLSQRDAAARAGLNYGSWSNWENGVRPQDRYEVAQQIAAALDIDEDWLMWGGPLAGPRGVPTKRPSVDNQRYPGMAVQTKPTRSNGLTRTGVPGGPGRRAVRVDWDTQVAA